MQASYWALPSIMIVGALLLATLTRSIDGALGWEIFNTLNLLTVTTAQGARTVLSVIAAAAIGVAGTSFSITIVAVSYASGQFGPRLIGNFMRDRSNQVTLGIFMATFVYALVILGSVTGGIEATENGTDGLDAFVPHLSVLVATMLALVSVVALIIFFHHVPESINVGRLVSEIGLCLRQDADDLFPGEPAAPGPLPDPRGMFDGLVKDRTGTSVEARQDGYLQTLATGRLAELAEEHGLFVELYRRPGDFASCGEILMCVYPPPGGAVSADTANALRGVIGQGRQRTVVQNYLFRIDQLAEIIIKALSPGINDPFTAINCFHWLRAGIAGLADIKDGGPVLMKGGRVLTARVTFAEVLSAAFDQTRPYVAADRNVALHVMDVLHGIEATCADRARQSQVAGHRDALLAAAEAMRPTAPWIGELKARHSAAGDAREGSGRTSKMPLAES